VGVLQGGSDFYMRIFGDNLYIKALPDIFNTLITKSEVCRLSAAGQGRRDRTAIKLTQGGRRCFGGSCDQSPFRKLANCLASDSSHV
jgi:hypothetical protein